MCLSSVDPNRRDYLYTIITIKFYNSEHYFEFLGSQFKVKFESELLLSGWLWEEKWEEKRSADGTRKNKTFPLVLRETGAVFSVMGFRSRSHG